jgi:nicotinamidase-related amidase
MDINTLELPDNAALILIDVQDGLDDPYWGVRNNTDAEQNMVRLLTAWREQGRPVYFIHHQSKLPQSPLRPGQPGNAIKAIVAPRPDEPVISKTENSAFIGTDLEARLRAAGHETLVLIGLTTDHCVSTTTRMAKNLGFAPVVVSDATATFDRVSPLSGRHYSADEIHEAELTSLNGEFAVVAGTDAVLAAAERG